MLDALFEVFEGIGTAIGGICKFVWNGLCALWDIVVKVVTTVLNWAVNIMNWAFNLAANIITGIAMGIYVAFVWILGGSNQAQDEEILKGEIEKKLGKPHQRITIKGVLNKQTGKLENAEIVGSQTVEQDVERNMGGNNFAKLEYEVNNQ